MFGQFLLYSYERLHTNVCMQGILTQQKHKLLILTHMADITSVYQSPVLLPFRAHAWKHMVQPHDYGTATWLVLECEQKCHVSLSTWTVKSPFMLLQSLSSPAMATETVMFHLDGEPLRHESPVMAQTFSLTHVGHVPWARNSRYV